MSSHPFRGGKIENYLLFLNDNNIKVEGIEQYLTPSTSSSHKPTPTPCMDISPSIQKSVPQTCRDLYKQMPQNERFKCFANILGQLNQQLDEVDQLARVKVGHETHLLLVSPITSYSDDGKLCLNLSKIHFDKLETSWGYGSRAAENQQEDKILYFKSYFRDGFYNWFKKLNSVPNLNILSAHGTDKIPNREGHGKLYTIWASEDINQDTITRYIENPKTFSQHINFPAIRNQLVLWMDESSYLPNNGVLSLGICTFETFVEGYGTAKQKAYSLAFYSDDR